MSDLYYMSEKYGTAVRLMATTDSPLRERVRDAWVSSARLAHTVGGGRPEVQPSDALVKRMEDLAENVTMDGAYDTSFKVMTDAQIEEVAEEIYDIHIGIHSELRDVGR